MKFSIDGIDFYGPLDLLLELIKSKKCEIKDIFIKNIIEQYLEIIEKIDDSVEVTSNFIVLASLLLDLKSRYLLSLDEDEDEDVSSKNLFQILEEYKIIRNISVYLQNLYLSSETYYSKISQEVIIEDIIDFSKYDKNDIFKIYSNLLKEKKEIANTKTLVSYKKASVEDKIFMLENILIERDVLKFSEFIENQDKDNTVASFLGMLELSKSQKIKMQQKASFDDILIKKVENDQ